MSKPLHHILYVEDDADIRMLAGLTLEQIGGFKLTEAENGQVALDQLQSIKPDLILMDMMMPVMDGMTALAQIKQHPEWSSIPVIFMTARVQPQEVNIYLNAGALGVITKPFDPMTLADQVTSLWKQHHEQA